MLQLGEGVGSLSSGDPALALDDRGTKTPYPKPFESRTRERL